MEIPRLKIIGGAAYRRPTPITGDLDINIQFSTKINQEDWENQFSSPEILALIREVSVFIWDLWGEHIELDLGVSDNTWTVIFKKGRPYTILPYRRFDWEYCL